MIRPDDPEETILYIIGELLKCMGTRTGWGRYRSMLRLCRHLLALVWYAAIWEDRNLHPPTLVHYPEDRI